MVRWIIYLLLGYVALFTIVWLHEIGHSFIEYKFAVRTIGFMYR